MSQCRSSADASSGKTLGGSTSINGAAQTRGQKAQYDALATLLGGDDGGGRWNWDGMLAGMKKVSSRGLEAELRLMSGRARASAHQTTTSSKQAPTLIPTSTTPRVLCK